MGIKIGGEFELSVDVLKESPKNYNMLSLKKEKYISVDTGRSALYVALQEIIKKVRKREAWIPMFCCDSVVAPFIQLGFTVNYYSMGDDLRSPSKLPNSLEDITFLFINYFGKKNETIIEWLEHNRKKSTVVIEDNVQAVLSDNVGNNGDYVIYSLRKYLPQPDGALLAYNGETISPQLLEPNEQFISEKVIGKLLRGADADAETFLKLFSSSEESVDGQIKPRMMSVFSRFLFDRVNLAQVKQVRRDNWTYIQTSIKALKGNPNMLHPLYDELESEEVPLGYPIVVKNQKRDQLKHYLASYDIFCPVHWPIPMNRSRSIENYTDYQLSTSILTLPIDQRLSRKEIQYMVDKISEFYGEITNT
ncbi:DegT/DnrJ/EryC1/StrS family aminotransferase [Brevibacillus porteri]|uniref:DegT/DnrJ/EryC1/StrS aminotransferase family protein n=1 Tax=Brevibacillus porteri TaxID=2126350 RepID=A0ABX5FPJ9_9BACL|nr:DegT/DnrJ/EryC1/StrS family aminotransferase [Brevibacillus porteri]MED1801454.1 DegT/DnrJ/EryC1/StrS family aminotransferase [Brevibacillus porteri]MED2133843.1 DegT/DnrJ/EryC1/StrS family aminotransferase [Brevibacillus porteri]MED2748249.1 DegT/DnrJ/EryC1/StrS family aminotransferase [Brevibacillus porteri]MED2815387.1 DegT/DnrJ/EryC1/StrS family aminotransferase [Brevibacillus porteri]MED2894806.1 DegT/DnrJ/EryC1/StrS family aminotransferase [Brevibacillus porteri]